MISVKVTDKVVIVSGHAMFADAGKDIVCSGVSSITFGTLNWLEQFGKSRTTVEANKITINYVESDKQAIDQMIVQLQTIEESYPKFIKIDKGNQNV